MSKDFPFIRRTGDFPYVCVHCGNPSKSLYYQLGASLSSIKVLTCSSCGEMVDPYIEREWLHIAIDCILMRTEAYRHVLYNSGVFQRISTRQRIQMLCAWACLDSYLKWERHRIDVGVSSQLLESKGFILSLFLASLMGRLLEWLAVRLHARRKFKNYTDDKDSISDTLFMALMLPSSFTIVTIVVLMWENTTTVRLLGSLMIAYWQGLAVSVVSGDVVAPGVVFAIRIMWKAALSTLDIPCGGVCKLLSSPGDLRVLFESIL